MIWIVVLTEVGLGEGGVADLIFLAGTEVPATEGSLLVLRFLFAMVSVLLFEDVCSRDRSCEKSWAEKNSELGIPI
jgi:hypothetical protein